MITNNSNALWEPTSPMLWKKRYKEKAYSYFSLKYREGEKVVNQHVRVEQVPALRKQLDQRKKIEKEMKSYQKRIVTIGSSLAS